MIACLIAFIVKEEKKKIQKLQRPNPKYVLLHSSEKYLENLKITLESLGYERTSNESKDWNLFWSFETLFYSLDKHLLRSPKSNQKVNHIVGNGKIACKSIVSLYNLPFQPRSFLLPRDKNALTSFFLEHPSAMFLEKLNTHRGVVLRDRSYLTNLESDKTFVQEFISNPLLIDGYKFDVGVYVIITSVDPLRVFIYTGEFGFRFCPKKYHPLDVKNLGQYVVADDYLAAWDVPVLRKYFKPYKFGMKDAFDSYARSIGREPNLVWDQVEEIIRFIIKYTEKQSVQSQLNYNPKADENYVEMFRFDFIIDDNFKVYFIEANASPNLYSGLHKENQYLFLQLVHMYLKLIGMGSQFDIDILSSQQEEDIAASAKNLMVDADNCLKFDCEHNCNLKECKMCYTCLTPREYNLLKRAYIEHMNKMDLKRIIPRPISNASNFDIDKEVEGMNEITELLTRWYYEKCKMNSIWCS